MEIVCRSITAQAGMLVRRLLSIVANIPSPLQSRARMEKPRINARFRR